MSYLPHYSKSTIPTSNPAEVRRKSRGSGQSDFPNSVTTRSTVYLLEKLKFWIFLILSHSSTFFLTMRLGDVMALSSLSGQSQSRNCDSTSLRRSETSALSSPMRDDQQKFRGHVSKFRRPSLGLWAKLKLGLKTWHPTPCRGRLEPPHTGFDAKFRFDSTVCC